MKNNYSNGTICFVHVHTYIMMHAYTFHLVIESKETRKIGKEWFIYQVMEHSWLKISAQSFILKKLSYAKISLQVKTPIWLQTHCMDAHRVFKKQLAQAECTYNS